jgi:hypothetical protein
MIGIVYHCYLVNNWKEIVIKQLTRIKNSGLYDAADLFFTTVNCEENLQDEFKEILKDYNKIQIEFSENKHYEYPGLKKIKDLGNEYDDIKLLYFHAKGVSNKYIRKNQPEISEEKVKNIESWRECLEYFVIDKWKESIEKLNEFDNVGVTCYQGWYWGNFWWSQSKHIKKCRELDFWGRWDYEAWLNSYVENPKNFEWFNFNFAPYVTFIDPNFYKSPMPSSKIILHKAEYGVGYFEIDEGYPDYPLNTNKDVTEIVKAKLELENNERFNLRSDNETMQENPIINYRKFLFLNFSLENNLEKIYKIAFAEGSQINYKP